MGIIALLVAILSIPLFYELDPDFGWHLFLGNQMQATGSLTHTLIGYSYFSNLSLIDHQWLSHYFLQLVYNHFGYFPLILLCAGIAYVTCLFAYKDAKRLGAEWQYIILSLLLYLSSLKIVYGVRIQLLLLLGVSLLMWIGKYVPRLWVRRLFYFLIFCIGNNLHGGFILLAIIPLLLELHKVCATSQNDRWLVVKEYILTVALIGFSLAINPFGINILHLTGDYITDSYYKSHIDEWRSAFTLPISGESTVIPMLITVFMLSLKKFWRSINWGESLLLVFFGLLGFVHIRFFPIFILVATPYVALAIHKEFPINKLSVVRVSLVMYGIIALWLLGTTFGLINMQWAHPLQIESASGYPHVAMEKIRSNNKCNDGLLFNPYIWGGYILGFNPQTKVFIDGRGPQLRINPTTTLLQEYNSFNQKDVQKISEKLQHYSIQCVLIERPRVAKENITSKIFRSFTNNPQIKQEDYLLKYLMESKSWQKLYQDGIAEIYVHKDSLY